MKLIKPQVLAFIGDQERSIKAMIHCLKHGAVVGSGKARGVLLADEQGTGKTPCTIITCNTLRYQRILIIGPNSLRDTAWDKEIKKWQTLHHPIYHLTSGNIGHFSPGFLKKLKASWVIANYDILYKYRGIKDSEWDVLIADEAIALKNAFARRTVSVF